MSLFSVAPNEQVDHVSMPASTDVTPVLGWFANHVGANIDGVFGQPPDIYIVYHF